MYITIDLMIDKFETSLNIHIIYNRQMSKKKKLLCKDFDFKTLCEKEMIKKER